MLVSLNADVCHEQTCFFGMVTHKQAIRQLQAEVMSDQAAHDQLVDATSMPPIFPFSLQLLAA